MGRVTRAVVIVFMFVGPLPAAARGAVIFQTSSAPGGPIGGGVAIYDQSYVGVRFQLAQDTTLNRVGLRMTGLAGPGSIFGSIVRLSSMSDFPDSTHPFNTPDVLATTLLPIPASTTDVTADIGPITVPAGTYALLFGAGEFGANGDAAASQNNTPVGPQSYFYWVDSNGAYLDGSYGNVRFYVLNEVPEPSSGAVAIWVAAAAGLSRRRRTLAS